MKNKSAFYRYFFNVIDLDTVEYAKIYNLQKNLVRIRQLGLIYDSLILVEHPPIFTIGRKGSRTNLLISEDGLEKRGLELLETDRGGDITFHGHGQLVLYPVFDLSSRKKDISLYIRMLEEAVIRFLWRYNVTGHRIQKATGVWIDNETKIASIGIGVSKWVTYHGLSVNINTPLHYFDMIRPCGLKPCKIISLSSILGRDIDIDEAKKGLIEIFKDLFDINYDATISTLDKEKATLL